MSLAAPLLSLSRQSLPAVSSLASHSFHCTSLSTTWSSLLQPQTSTNCIFVRNVSGKALRNRMTAITNIKKITKAMKMVASAKLKKSEEALKTARAFAKPIEQLFAVKEKKLEDEGGHTLSVPANKKPNKYLVAIISADRGLCGSVNGSLSRAARNKALNGVRAGLVNELTIFGVGEKARTGLERHAAKYFSMFVTDYTKLKRATFKQASQIAEYFVKLQTQHDAGEIVFNRFKNMMSFDVSWFTFQSPADTIAAQKFTETYEVEGDAETLENLNEFRWATTFYHLFQESETTELSQRVNAMGSSNKNAGQMLDRVRLKYNRQRQAKITTELVEIISGAESVKSGEQ